MELRDTILAALTAGPKTIFELAGNTLTHRRRAPVRAQIDVLLGESRVRTMQIGTTRALALTEWQITDEFLVKLFRSRTRKESGHLIWEGSWWEGDERAIMVVDGKRYDVGRFLFQVLADRKLGRLETLIPKCGHERCVGWRCQQVTVPTQAGRTVNVVTRAKQANQMRARSKYSPELISMVRASDKSLSQISQETGVPRSTVGAVRRGQIWRDYTNPYAALMGVRL